MQNNDRTLEILMDIKREIGQIQAMIKAIDNTLEAHTEADDKFQDGLLGRLDTYNSHLAEHMRRTDLLEDSQAKMNPIINFSNWLTVSLKVIAAVATVLGVLKVTDLI